MLLALVNQRFKVGEIMAISRLLGPQYIKHP